MIKREAATELSQNESGVETASFIIEGLNLLFIVLDVFSVTFQREVVKGGAFAETAEKIYVFTILENRHPVGAFFRMGITCMAIKTPLKLRLIFCKK